MDTSYWTVYQSGFITLNQVLTSEIKALVVLLLFTHYILSTNNSIVVVSSYTT